MLAYLFLSLFIGFKHTSTDGWGEFLHICCNRKRLVNISLALSFSLLHHIPDWTCSYHSHVIYQQSLQTLQHWLVDDPRSEGGTQLAVHQYPSRRGLVLMVETVQRSYSIFQSVVPLVITSQLYKHYFIIVTSLLGVNIPVRLL